MQSLERGLAVIRAFDEHNAELTLSDVARATGLTRAAARRFLLTLADLGYVRTDGRWFSLSPRILELGYAYLSSQSLTEVAEPHLERLVAEVHESSSVSVLDGEDIVYVARVPTARIMAVSINVGTRFPAYATSMGRVLLSRLPDEELEAYLERVELRPLSPRTLTVGRRCCGSSSRRCARRAGRSSTRSSRRACARSPRRSATAPGARSPPSTCPRTRAGCRSTRAGAASCRRCSATAARIEADLRVAQAARPQRSSGG